MSYSKDGRVGLVKGRVIRASTSTTWRKKMVGKNNVGLYVFIYMFISRQ